MLASGSCLLTDVVDQLHESVQKINSVDHLAKHLKKGTPAQASKAYLSLIKKWVPAEPVIHIDDSDVVKPNGYKFEALGIVRDGSESTSTKNVYKKGYHVTEACVLTTSNHPVSLFSRIHSSAEENYSSANTITFDAMQRGAALFGKATFVMDRGYDANKMFLELDRLKQDYVIRLKSNRKLLYHNKWTKATELRNRRKGKVKMKLFYKGKPPRSLSFTCKSTDNSLQKRYLSSPSLWDYREPNDAGNQQRNPLQRRCYSGCKALLLEVENRGIFP